MHKQQRGVYVFKNIFYTRLLEIMVLFVYKTNAIRPMLQDQDQDCSLQDQDQFLLVWDRSCHKTEVSDHITGSGITWLIRPNLKGCS